jgi:hypothetical protein
VAKALTQILLLVRFVVGIVVYLGFDLRRDTPGRQSGIRRTPAVENEMTAILSIQRSALPSHPKNNIVPLRPIRK